MVTQVALYARVSSEQQVEGFSIEAQLRAMREFAAAQHWTIFREYVDEGYSASTAERPQFQILLRDASVRLFDGLLIHKLDRLYRNVSQLLEMVDTLEKQGIALISVLERIDFSTPSGKMLLTNIGMISEFYLNNLREETVKGKYQRALSGLWNGDIPYGYCKGLCSRCDDPNGKGYCPDYGQSDKTVDRRLIAHPKDSVGLSLAFTWHCAGKLSDQDVTDQLNRCGYRTRCKLTKKPDPIHPGGSKPFSKDTVRAMLKNQSYLGLVKYKGQLLQGTHPPLITREIFEQSQEVRKRWHRNASQRRAAPRVFMLTGVLRCAYCHFPMRGTTNPDGTRYYRDTAREYSKLCPRHGMLTAEELELELLDQLHRVRLPDVWRERIMQLATATPEQSQREEKRRLLNSQLERLQKLFVQGDMAEEDYDRRREKIRNELEEILAQEPAIIKQATRVPKRLSKYMDSASPLDRKRIVGMLLRSVHVGKNIERIEPRKPFMELFPGDRRT
ncbi:MAG: recombinase family protein [Chloroflexi bacterium]|nr:recombinase family protein [Chloroflexota bacterium]